MDGDKIKYSDIIQPDDSIEKLVKQLGELNQSYETMVNAIRAGADRIVHALKGASGATNEGRKAIDEAAASTSRLERAQYELKMAMSDTGKQIAWLKAQTVDQNKATVEQRRYLQQALTSYDRLRSDLKQTVSLYKSLTAAERADSAMGQQLLRDIINLKNQIKVLDDQMKPHIQTLTAVQKAEQKLAYLQSEEGQRLLELKAKIAEVTAARRQQKATIDPLVQAHERLAFANSKENQQLKLYSTLIQESNRIAKLQAQVARSAEGSYNRLSAQYELNKIKLNQMSQAEREAADSGKKLEAETASIYQQMIKLQEATGNYRLSVGHYQKSWDGLGFSIAQVVRELPAAVITLNTFFLAISNNIPMVVDEINKLRAENKLLLAEGKETKSIIGSIVKSLFGWNTILVVMLTAFSLFGDQIVKWIGNLFKAKEAVISTSKAFGNINKELEKTNSSYGDNVTSIKKLQNEWKNLKTTAEKVQWIKDNNSEFNKLDINVRSVNDAENAFIGNTDVLLEAMKGRAKAAAAIALASKKYEEALQKQAEADKIALDRDEELRKTAIGTVGTAVIGGGIAGYTQTAEYDARAKIESVSNLKIKKLEEEREVAEKTADAYFKIAEAEEAGVRTRLKAAGIEEAHKIRESHRQPRDLTSILNQNSIKAQKQYEDSVTALRKDEFAKRRKIAIDEVRDENNKLREMLRKNDEYVKNVDGKYKQLTDGQKKQIEQQNKWVTDTIANNLKALSLQLEQIQREQAVNALKIQREAQTGVKADYIPGGSGTDKTVATSGIAVTRDASQIGASLVAERELVRQNLEAEYALVLGTNAKLLAAGDEHARSEEEILIEFNKKKLQLYANYDKQILDSRERDIESQLILVKKGTDDELRLLLQQNDIRRQLTLAENVAKPSAEQVSSSSINAEFNKSASLIKGSFQLASFDEQQALDEAIFNEVKRNETEITKFRLEQEKARWQKQIELAEADGLDWSKAQIDTAKSTVKGIDMELSKLNNVIANIGEKGLGGTLLEKLGFDDDQIDALKYATNVIIEQFQAILDAEVELAEKQVELAEKRVASAQKSYEAEIEARNNGYANRVSTARKELEEERRMQRDKQKMLESAQKRQEALNSVTQASSLITASANLWSSLSAIPIVGHALAIAAIATMWKSFATAKIKAKQVTVAGQSEEYGDGGLEFLEGGSHASGNDIDLETTNSRGKKMRAEGGEALAIINKRRTRKYREVLPDVIDSFNKGTFEDKYLSAFSSGDLTNINAITGTDVDLSKIERDLEKIAKQNMERIYVDGQGRTIVKKNNLTRIIR